MTTLPVYDDIVYLLPHRNPMVLVDRVEERGPDHLVASVDLSRPTLFTDADGRVPAYVGLEFMAQAISAYIGAVARDAGRPIRLGFFLGTRKYQAADRFFPTGETIRVHIRTVMMEEGFGSFDSTIFTADGGEFATAQIKALQPDNVEELFAGL